MKIFKLLLFTLIFLIPFCLIIDSSLAESIIDINQASFEELQGLYRVGPIIAERIIKEREANGPFRTLEEVAERVKGVGPSMISRWSDVAYPPLATTEDISPEREAELRKLELQLLRGEARLYLNSAPADELQLLYKVGPTLSARIVKEREQNGPYRSLRELSVRVEGVGEKMIGKWKDYVSLPLQTQDDLPSEEIDINRADLQNLQTLYHVGPVLAQRIIKEREENGSFSSLEELIKRVKGIGPTMVGNWQGKVVNQMFE